MLLLKIGGSLLTKKDSYCELNTPYVKNLAEAVAALRLELPSKILIVAGGGSFGSGIMFKLGLNMEDCKLRDCEYSKMTRVMFKYMSDICEIFSDAGVALFPFQIAPFLCTSNGLSQLLNAIDSAMNANLLPLVSSDYFQLSCHKWIVMPSDRLLVELARATYTERVVTLTNICGIIDFSNATTINFVTNENLPNVLALTSGSNLPDATGGMRAKLLSLVEVSKMGIEVAILDGRDPLLALGDITAKWNPYHPRGTIVQVRDV